ncbi:ABC transporter ATP-binding protein [Rarobacter faecitabidus]|uniref:ABC-2 type transport system ATP-binding protein n=1 Tax=Rarobacter faecitabidus TaxID=13243 RepID=A0A542ZAX1_RARFA|nr:ABC transporter ATP-binding protein [Rarobacter faecitabidus]TQL57493.1 ABC-2 type transport system ATP-binding protein [Rarobacter faecitabidus]
MTTVIKATGLTREFRTGALPSKNAATRALADVSFTVNEGMVYGLLGRNGAGKTTLMSIITGQDRPTRGTIEVLGHAPFEHAPTSEAVSFIRDNQRYPDDFTLRFALKSAARFRPNWDAELAARLSDTFRLPSKTPIKKYSRGQLSALAIILGLAARTPLTLLDEPYLGLDATARQAFYDILLNEQLNHPRTFLISTHLVTEMENIFDHAIVIDRGRIALDSPVDDLSGTYTLVSGLGTRVAEFTRDAPVLQTRTVGALVSTLVAKSFSKSDIDSARADGLEVAPADLQSVVSALGATSEQPADQADA